MNLLIKIGFLFALLTSLFSCSVQTNNVVSNVVEFNKAVKEAQSGNLVALDKETDEFGIYNAEYVICQNSSFKNIQGMALNLLPRGTDESTFGPSFTINHCVFDNVGFGKRNKSKVALYIRGVQITNIRNSIFTNIQNCNFFNSEGVLSNNNFYNKEEITLYNPEFIAESYSLKADSKLKGKATDGSWG